MKTAKYISEFLSAKNVKGPQVVSIASVEQRTFKGDDGESKRETVVVFFKELDQGVVLCRTSLRQLIEIFGSDESNDWLGKQVVIFNDESVQYKGKRIGGIRFRPVA